MNRSRWSLSSLLAVSLFTSSIFGTAESLCARGSASASLVQQLVLVNGDNDRYTGSEDLLGRMAIDMSNDSGSDRQIWYQVNWYDDLGNILPGSYINWEICTSGTPLHFPLYCQRTSDANLPRMFLVVDCGFVVTRFGFSEVGYANAIWEKY